MATRPVTHHRVLRCASLLLACVFASLFLTQCGIGNEPAQFTKEPLPYALDALEPYISAQAMDLHYNKHYAGYVKKAIALTSGTACGGKTPEEVIRMTAGDAAVADIFNNAAQAWNHAFYFKALKPKGGGEPEGRLAEMIDGAFGSYDDFKEAFIKAASGQFGSGWAWLVLKDGQVAIFTSGNADTPIAHDMLPLFGVDVWEHAYYLDYQNRRAEFVETVLDKLANWEFVASQLPEEASPAAGEAVTEVKEEPAVAPEAEAEVTEEAVEAETAPAQAPETTHEAAPAEKEDASHADQAHHG
ncbi:MAG: superoxide dismutase [Sulfuricellaceae bacterium]